MKLFRKNKSKYYRYDFTVRGERYRGSARETNKTRAQKAADLKFAATIPYDRMASYLAPCGNIDALKVARELDAKVERILTAAAE